MHFIYVQVATSALPLYIPCTSALLSFLDSLKSGHPGGLSGVNLCHISVMNSCATAKEYAAVTCSTLVFFKAPSILYPNSDKINQKSKW